MWGFGKKKNLGQYTVEAGEWGPQQYSKAILDSCAATIELCSNPDSARDPKTSLRSSWLTPTESSYDIIHDKNDYRKNLERFEDAVDSVCRKKMAKFPADFQSSRAYSGPSHGRVLLCEPNECMIDEVMEPESHGFFDRVDVPPWDCWFGFALQDRLRKPNRDYQRGWIISWVPEWACGYASKGMHVSMNGQVEWLDEAVQYYKSLEPLCKLLGVKH